MQKINLAATLIFCLGLSAHLSAQRVTYLESKNAPLVISDKGDTLKNAWAGGFANPQFNTIDVDGDGVEDVVVFDRSDGKNLVYLAKPNFKFIHAPELEILFPQCRAWVRLVDYNHDGKKDFFAYSQEGAGVEIYKNITTTAGQLRWKKITGLLLDFNKDNLYCSPGDIPYIGDIDGDGDIDVLAIDIYQTRIQLYRCRSFDKYGTNYNKYDSLDYALCDGCWGRIEEPAGGNIPILNIKDAWNFCDNKFLKFHKKHGSFSLNIFDEDGDGDMDLVQGDLYSNYLILMKNGKSSSTKADSISSYDTTYLSKVKRPVMPTFLQSFFEDINGDGKRDLLVSAQDGGNVVSFNSMWYFKNTGSDKAPDFKFVQKDFLQNEVLSAGLSASPAFLDYDHDGDMDMVIATQGDYAQNGHNADKLVLYKNIGTVAKPVFKKVNDDYMGISKRKWWTLTVAFGDLNGDGKPDMLMGENSGTIAYYKNIATTGNDSFVLVDANLDAIDVGYLSTPAIADINNDSLNDIVIGNLDGTFSYYQNKGVSGTPSFKLITAKFGDTTTNWYYREYNSPTDTPLVPSAYGSSSPICGDFDNDGKLDMMSGSWHGVLMFFPDIRANLTGKFSRVESLIYNNTFGKYSNKSFGTYTRPAAYNYTKDSIQIFLGTSRGGVIFLQPTINYTVIADTFRRMDFRLYPNPTKNDFTIEGDIAQSLEISINNMLGQLVLKKEVNNFSGQETISVANYPKGVYLIMIKDSKKGVQVQKLVVE
ncbi:MAG: T9SS type A sorting domain-containing protein [Bacteroidetes bacterium]|nr:T9SS type A sorting domain-containing protein [Bacteroidota bacterium]